MTGPGRHPVPGSGVKVNARPLAPLLLVQERERGDEDVVDVLPTKSCVLVNEVKVKVDLTKYNEKHQFNFDEALDENVSNESVYKLTVGPLVKTLFRLGRASCFAYGQTGSGKTYTMGPLPIRASAEIFQYLTCPEFRDVILCVSCFEIYGNKVHAMRSHACVHAYTFVCMGLHMCMGGAKRAHTHRAHRRTTARRPKGTCCGVNRKGSFLASVVGSVLEPSLRLLPVFVGNA